MSTDTVQKGSIPAMVVFQQLFSQCPHPRYSTNIHNPFSTVFGHNFGLLPVFYFWKSCHWTHLLVIIVVLVVIRLFRFCKVFARAKRLKNFRYFSPPNTGSYMGYARSPSPSQRPASTTIVSRSPFPLGLCSCSTSLSKMGT